MKEVFAIGGVGGSGTRVIARILMESGVYIGDDLTPELDNLIFSRLLKNSKWYKHASVEHIQKRIRIFEKYMNGQRWTIPESIEYYIASQTNPQRENTKIYHLGLCFKKLKSEKQLRSFWGWKEPNTEIFLNPIIGYFHNFKYIHVIRHGLDMAFSTNCQQLLNWGPMFGIHVHDPSDREEIAIKQLDYWIKINKLALNTCRERISDRFLVIDYTKFSKNPEVEVPRLLNFLDIHINDLLLRNLVSIPVISKSEGRYKQEDLSIFNPNQLNEVLELGFEI